MAALVMLEDGERGILETDSPFWGPGKAVVRLDSGRRLIVREEALIARDDGSYRLPFTATQLENPVGIRSALADEPVVVPVLAETLAVGKRTVVTGGVRVTKRVSEREETVDEPLLREDVHVERVPVNQIVAEAPQARYEGDMLIVPVLEEVLVVEKRLMLKEEVRIQRAQTQTHQPQQVLLRAEDVVIEEIAATEPQF